MLFRNCSARWAHLLTIVLLLVTTLASAVSARPPGSLAALLKASRWQKRVLLLCAPDASSAELLRQQQLLAPERTGLAERDIVVRTFVLNTQLPAADAALLREKLGVASKGFTVLLIGKDGGVKRRETQPVSAASLFATIDGMPMRREEMRRKP